MYNYQNNKKRKDCEEIDLLEVIGMVFNHFRMIVVFVIVFSLIGVGIALLQPRKHDITAIVELKTPGDYAGALSKYGVEYYTASTVFNKMFSRENLEAAIPENDKELNYDKLMLGSEPVFSYGNISGTNYYKITASKISEKESDFYIAIINALVKSAQDDIVSTYTTPAEEGLKAVVSALDQFVSEINTTSLTSGTTSTVDDSSALEDGSSVTTTTSDYSSVLNSYLSNKIAIENYISMIPNALTWFEHPVVGEKNKGTSKATMCIIFFLVGGVSGALIGIVIDFMDNRIYSSDKLIEFLSDDLLSSIPLYKDSAKISPLEYTYISSKIDGRKSILVTSLSSGAGKTTLVNGLRGKVDAEIIDGKTISTTPELLKSARNNDLLVIVLRAGVDTYIAMDKLISDLKVQGINYAFVFNGVEAGDKDVNIYADRKDYEKHTWLKESRRRFYKSKYAKR